MNSQIEGFFPDKKKDNKKDNTYSPTDPPQGLRGKGSEHFYPVNIQRLALARLELT